MRVYFRIMMFFLLLGSLLGFHASIIQAEMRSEGGKFPFGAIYTKHPTIGVLMTTPGGDLMGVAVSRNSKGNIIGIDGVLFWGKDGDRITQFLDDKAMPTQAMINGVLVNYDNLTDQSVNLTLIPPNGGIESYPRVKVDPKLVALTRKFAETLTSDTQATLHSNRRLAESHAHLIHQILYAEIDAIEVFDETLLRDMELVATGAATYLSVNTCIALLPVAVAGVSSGPLGIGVVAVAMSASAACTSAAYSVEGWLKQARATIFDPKIDTEQIEFSNEEMALTFSSIIGDVTSRYKELSNPQDMVGGISTTLISLVLTELNDQYFADRRAKERLEQRLSAQEQEEARAEKTDRDGLLGSADRCPWQAGTLEDHGCPRMAEGKWQVDWRGGICRNWKDMVGKISFDNNFISEGSLMMNPKIKDGAFETPLSKLAPSGDTRSGKIYWTILETGKAVGAVRDEAGEYICGVVLTRVGDLEVSEWILVKDENVAEVKCANKNITLQANDTQFTYREKYQRNKKKRIENLEMSWGMPYLEDEVFKVDLQSKDGKFRRLWLWVKKKGASGKWHAFHLGVDTLPGMHPNRQTVPIPIHLNENRIEILIGWNSGAKLGCKLQTLDLHHYVFERAQN